MTSDRAKCGLSSLLPMSCRGRAEAFARRLHHRLRSLGSQDENGSATENSWLAAHENPIALSQPLKHPPDSEMFLDFGMLESPGSPEEEIEDPQLEKLLNLDRLKHSEACSCDSNKEKMQYLFNSIKATSNDSDSSDGPFYDTDNGTELAITNHINGLSHSSSGVTDSICENSQENSTCTDDLYVTSSECTLPLEPPQNSSLDEDVSLSTLSLKENDEDFDQGEDNSYRELTESLPETSPFEEAATCNGTENLTLTCLDLNKDLNGECQTNVQLESIEAIEEINEENKENKELMNEILNDEDNNEEVEERIPRVRRCSSLKTGKTPPGTPGRKKIVRFADVLGLDLADVRTFLDEIPKIPVSAYEDLKDVDLCDNDMSVVSIPKFHSNAKIDKVLVPLFQQPGGQTNFLDIVREKYVCLENALVDDSLSLSVTGMVRVRNLDFHKSVHIRYTLDSWHSFSDVQAVYVENSCDGFSDKFKFLIYAHTLIVGQQLQFAVRFQCKGCQYWDNNNGLNYCFQCLPSSNKTTYAPITGIEDSWGASFYYQEDTAIKPTGGAEHEPTFGLTLTHTAVQEIVTNSLGIKYNQHQQHIPKKSNSDVFTVFVILLFSFLFMYIQKGYIL